MDKVYLVASIYCYSDERMNKDFEIFYDKESAIEYFEELRSSIIADLMDREDITDEDELFSLYDETYDYTFLWGYLSPDGTTEYELEIIELNLMSWKEN